MATDKVFKGARVYKKITEDFPIDTFVVPNHEDLYVFTRDIDPDSESELDTDPSETSSELSGSFIASDTSEGIEPIEDDEVWKQWRPMSAGAQRFKDKVDQIEAHAKKCIDERFIFGD